MSLEVVKEKVEGHDRSLEMVATAIADLAAVTVVTNAKLDKVVDAMGMQNVLIERLNNMDKSVRDSFSRRDERIKVLESTHTDEGCGKLKASDENIRSLGRSIDTLRGAVEKGLTRSETRIDSVEGRVSTYVSGTVVRWALGIIVTIMIVLSTVDRTTHNIASEERDKLWDKINRVASAAHAEELVGTQSLIATRQSIVDIRAMVSKQGDSIMELKLKAKK